jgi:DNA-binding transcriptional LysR family regulator
MRVVQGFELYRKLAEPVARPNQLGSLMQLAKKARVTDDAARRLLDQLAAELNHPLIVVQDRRITLTDAGRQLLEVAVRLTSIAENTETPADVLTVEADSLLAECLLPQAFGSFLDLWASLVQLRVCPMQNDRTRRNIQDGTTAFGIAFAESGSVPLAETLGPKVSWVLVLPKNHRLARTHEPVSAESLSENDRVFIPEFGADWPGMDGVLKAVPSCNRVVCEATLTIRLAKVGLGGAIVPDLLPEGEFVCKRMIQGIDPVQPRFVFPRQAFDGLTEPEQSLVEQIRKVAEARCKPEAPKDQNDAEVAALTLVEETVTPMEEVLS